MTKYFTFDRLQWNIRWIQFIFFLENSIKKSPKKFRFMCSIWGKPSSYKYPAEKSLTCNNRGSMQLDSEVHRLDPDQVWAQNCFQLAGSVFLVQNIYGLEMLTYREYKKSKSIENLMKLRKEQRTKRTIPAIPIPFLSRPWNYIYRKAVLFPLTCVSSHVVWHANIIAMWATKMMQSMRQVMTKA